MEKEEMKKIILSHIDEIKKIGLATDESTQNSYSINILIDRDFFRCELKEKGNSDGGMNKGFQIDIPRMLESDYVDYYNPNDLSTDDLKEWTEDDYYQSALESVQYEEDIINAINAAVDELFYKE